MIKTFVSIAIWVCSVILTMAVCFAIFFFRVILYPFDKKRKIAHMQGFWWADCIIRLNPYWKLKVNGLENIDYHKTYVVIANHQSLADIIILYKTRMQFKWIAKESLFKVPFIGWSLSLSEHIKLARGEYSSIKKAYRKAAEWLRKDISVLIFPEGTRSDNGAMNVFQNGAFKLAIREKKPILPIRIKGTHNVMPKGSWIFKSKVSISITVLPAIDTAEFNPGDFAKLRDMAFVKIAGA